MPDYQTLPLAWKVELEKGTGWQPEIDVVVDPDGVNIVLGEKYGIKSLSPITVAIEPDVVWERRPTMREITVLLNDPDEKLAPHNPHSPFYDYTVIICENTPASVQSIYLEPTGRAFLPGQIINILGMDYINGYTRQQKKSVVQFTHSSEHDVIDLAEPLAFPVAKGSVVYAASPENTEITIRLKLHGIQPAISLFRGRLLKRPERGAGTLKLTLVDLNKLNLDKQLVGADNTVDKLMTLNADGQAENSIQWSSGAGGTLNRNDVYPLPGCGLGKWTINFITNTQYLLSGPGAEALRSDYRFGYTGRISGSENEPGFAWNLVKDYGYLYVPSINSGRLVIVNVENPSLPVRVSSIQYSNMPVYASVVKSTNYVFVPYTEFSGSFTGGLKCFHVADKYHPVLIDTKTAGSEGVPEDFAPVSCKIYGSYLYAAGYNSIFIFNISDPFNIQYVSRIGGEGAPNYMKGLWSFAVAGGYIYAISYIDQRFIIININSPALPALVSTLALDGGGYDVILTGQTAFVKTTDGRLVAINVGDPAAPYIISEFGGYGTTCCLRGYRMRTDGQFIYSANPVENAVQIIDVRDPANMTEFESIAGCGEPHYLQNTYDLELSGEYAYMAAENGVTIYRLNNQVANNQGGKKLRIVPAAWGGGIHAGESVTFTTSLLWQEENPVQIVYTLLTQRSSCPAGFLAASSFWGNKQIGVLAADLQNSDTVVYIQIPATVWIKAGETLVIGGCEALVTNGTLPGSAFPPQVAVEISPFAGALVPAGTVVEMKKRENPDPDFNFDAEYLYCEANNIKMSISLDRDMSVLQAIETVCAHFDAFLYADHEGVQRLFSWRENESLPVTISGDHCLLTPPAAETRELVNELLVKYGYNYPDNTYGKKLLYQGEPARISANRFGTIRQAELTFPGIYAQNLAVVLAEEKFKMWKNGITLVSFNVNLIGMAAAIGDMILLANRTGSEMMRLLVTGKTFKWSNGPVITITGIVKSETGEAV